MDRIDELIELISEDQQIVLCKDGSGRIENIETGETDLVFDNIYYAIFDLKNLN